MFEKISPEPRRYLEKGGADYLRYTVYDQSPVHRNRLAYIVDLVTTRSGGKPSRIADVGCGTGNITIPLASRGHEVHGTDIDEPSIEIARKRQAFPNLRFDRAGSGKREFGSYDFVVLSEVLEHVKAYGAMFSEIASTMKRGACLILTVPNGWSPVEIACRPSYFLKRSESGTRVVKAIKSTLQSKDLTTANEQTPHVQFFTLNKLQALFGQTGMRVAHAQGFFFIWPVWEIFLARYSSEKVAASDFRFSQQLPMQTRAMWCFALEKR